MKYKVGDKVKIKSLDWYYLNKNEHDYIQLLKYQFNYYMTKYCGLTAIIKQVNADERNYFIDIDNNFCWTDEMFEDENKEDITKIIDWEQRRYELAKAAMQGLCSVDDKGSFNNINEFYEITAMHSINIADELMRQLKQTNETK